MGNAHFLLVIFNFTQLFHAVFLSCYCCCHHCRRKSVTMNSHRCLFLALADMICGYGYNYSVLPICLASTYHIHILDKTEGTNVLHTCDGSQFTYQFHSMHRFYFPMIYSTITSCSLSCCVKPFNASQLYHVLRIKMAPFDLIHQHKIRMKFPKQKLIIK